MLILNDTEQPSFEKQHKNGNEWQTILLHFDSFQLQKSYLIWRMYPWKVWSADYLKYFAQCWKSAQKILVYTKQEITNFRGKFTGQKLTSYRCHWNRTIFPKILIMTVSTDSRGNRNCQRGRNSLYSKLSLKHCVENERLSRTISKLSVYLFLVSCRLSLLNNTVKTGTRYLVKMLASYHDICC